MKKSILFLSLMVGMGVSSVAQTNLLTNPGAENNYDGWTRTDGGDGWSINVVGNQGTATPRSGSNFWASSYQFCTLAQTVDLVSAGYSEAVLDAAPDISAGAFVRSNLWCAAVATIKVELCAANGSVISTHFVCQNLTIPMNSDWIDQSLVISAYGTGVRKINYYLMGKDGCGWGLYFGAQFDDSYLTIAGAPTTAINDVNSKTITISPNPSSDFITLGGNSGLIRIYDMKGSLVLSHNATTNERIDISSLTNGVYVLKTDNQNIKLVKK